MDKDLLDFLIHSYHSLKKIFFKVTTILHLKKILSSDKVAFSIIELKPIPKSPFGNMYVVVFKAVLKLEAQIKSLIIHDDKVASNIIELKLISEPSSSNMSVVIIEVVLKLKAQLQFLHHRQVQ